MSDSAPDSNEIQSLASNTPADLTESLSAMNKAIQELGRVVEMLSGTVAQLSRETTGVPDIEIADDPLTHTDKKVADEEEFWERVRDTTKEQDRETTDSWKDELNNLLVFAGLFSAVVTAFTVESYTWLQQDPGDASNILLSHLSLQLSTLTIAFANTNPAVSAIVNSTTPALSLSDVTSSFAPVSYAVSVNSLWFLSLTLSLVSAFFAIAVQQWLRQLRVPLDMPMRKAVQLLAFRQDGLKTWQVPGVISLLPLLLQLAVILFLVGLFLLLRCLSATVATAFGVVALIGLLAFLTTVIIPLVTPHCSYKSPIVPMAVVILQCLTYPLALISTPPIFVIGIALTVIIQTYKRTARRDCTPLDPALESLNCFKYFTLIPYIKSLGRHMFVDLSQFWLSREYCHISSCLGSEKAELERSSVIQTLLSVPSLRLPILSQALSSFGTEGWSDTTARVVVESLLIFRSSANSQDTKLNRWQYELKPKVASYVRQWLSTRRHSLLIQRLHNGPVSPNDADVLLDHYKLDGAFAGTPRPFAKLLLHICTNQQISRHCPFYELAPVCLIFDAVLKRKYTLEADDIAAVFCFSLKFLKPYELEERTTAERYILISTATVLSLIAGCTTHAISTEDVPRIVKMFAIYLNKDSTKKMLEYALQLYYDNPGGWSNALSLFVSPANIQGALCGALADYACTLTLPRVDASHLEDLVQISKTLREIYKEGFRYTINGIPESEEAKKRNKEKQRVYESLDELDGALLWRGWALKPRKTASPVDEIVPSHSRDYAEAIDPGLEREANPSETFVTITFTPPRAPAACVSVASVNDLDLNTQIAAITSEARFEDLDAPSQIAAAFPLMRDELETSSANYSNHDLLV